MADADTKAEETARDERFDPVKYYYSTERAPKSLSSLGRLSLGALRLVRRASPRLFALVSSMQAATVLLLGMQVLLGKIAIGRVLGVARDTGSLGNTILPLAGLVVATALSGLIAATQTNLQRLLSERVQRTTWDAIFTVTTTVPLESFESFEFFDALQRVKTLAIIQPLQLAQGLFSLIGGLAGVVVLTVALLAIQPLLVPLLLIGAIPQVLISRRTGQIEFDFNVRQTAPARYRSYLVEVLTGRVEAKEVRAFGLSGTLRRRWERNMENYLGDIQVHITRRLLLALLGATVTIVTTTAALALLIGLVDANRMSLAAAGAGLIAIRLLAGRVQQVTNGLSALFESGLFLRDYEQFIARAPAPEPSATGESVKGFDELRVEHLGFRYPGSGRSVLHDVSLTIRRGEVIAIVGANGSGKTTLAKILGGMFEPTTGRVLWDGRDVTELNRDQVRSSTGLMFQDFVQYQLSARENVGFGRHEWLEEEDRIREAARKAGADRYLSTLPEGYETGLGKEFMGGFDLSGGQWQRVALARAFFRDAAFLVLDEPSAALDARAEFELFQQITELARGRTVLLISHRFSTVKSADRIIVMDEGEILEEGSHAELMAMRGCYAELFDLQAQSYR